MVGARVLDASSGGLFLRPPSDGPLPKPGTSLLVVIPPSERHRGLRLSGRVRWSGFSQTHGCEGVGIELDEVTDFATLLPITANADGRRPKESKKPISWSFEIIPCCS